MCMNAWGDHCFVYDSDEAKNSISKMKVKTLQEEAATRLVTREEDDEDKRIKFEDRRPYITADEDNSTLDDLKEMIKRKVREDDPKGFYTENIMAVWQELYDEKISFNEQYGADPDIPVSLIVMRCGSKARISIKAVSKDWPMLRQFCVKAQERNIKLEYRGESQAAVGKQFVETYFTKPRTFLHATEKERLLLE